MRITLLNVGDRHRIREVLGGYRIDEIVSDQGYWITWPELFNTESSALEFLSKKLTGRENIETLYWELR